MAAVMIGIDPHKGSHTAVAIGTAEEPPGELRVRASAARRLFPAAPSSGERPAASRTPAAPPSAAGPDGPVPDPASSFATDIGSYRETADASHPRLRASQNPVKTAIDTARPFRDENR